MAVRAASADAARRIHTAEKASDRAPSQEAVGSLMEMKSAFSRTSSRVRSKCTRPVHGLSVYVSSC